MSVRHLPTGVVTALAAALLHSLWQCAVLVAAADATMRLLHRRSAALRHTAGMGFLVSMALAPACTFLLGLFPRPGGTAPGIPGVTAIAPLGSASDALVQTMNTWAAPLCAAWILGVVAMLLRQAGGLWWLDRLDRRAVHPLPPEWRERLQALQHTMGVSRAIVIRLADDVLVPFTARLFRPIIWIPRALLTRLSQGQVEALMAHELAHIRRLDWLWNGLQCVIEALLFFHPGVWWLSRRIREERELACDAIAATVCADPVPLAEALAALARDRRPRPQLLLAADAHPLLDRITLLLSDAPAPARSAPPIGLVAAMLTGAVLAAQLGSRIPVALHLANPAPMVEVSTVHDRIGPSVAKDSARRASDSGPRALDAGRGTAAVIERNQLARDTEPVALGRREAVLRTAEETIRAREHAVRVAEAALRDPEEAAPTVEAPTTAPAGEVPTAARAVEAPTTARAVEAPTTAPAVEAPTAARAAKAPTATRAVEAVKAFVPYAADPVQAQKDRSSPRKGGPAPQ